MGRRREAKPSEQKIRTLHGSYPDDELDLHGLGADDAEFRVRAFIDRWARTQPGAVLRIITGKGKGSGGTPVLRTRVHALLMDDLAPVVEEWAGEPGAGSFLVRVRRPR